MPREAVDVHRPDGGAAGSTSSSRKPQHKIEIYNHTGRVAESPLDEMNRREPRSTSPPELTAADPANTGGAACQPYARRSPTPEPVSEKPESSAVKLEHSIVAFALEAVPQTAPIPS